MLSGLRRAQGQTDCKGMLMSVISQAPTLLDSIAPQVLDVHESQILEVAERAYGRDDVIRLYAGESDEPTPAFIVEAAHEAMQAGQTRYTLSRGVPELREAIAAYNRRTYGVPVQAGQITVTVGGMQALSQTLLALLKPGDELLVPVPVWPNILEATKIARAVPRAVPMQFDAGRGWMLNLQDLFAAVTPATRAVFINSPANPTGWMMTAEEMQALLAFCRERGLWVISDEVYGRMVYDGSARAPSMLDFMAPDDQVVICNTMSKNWSMTGWRVGWALTPEPLGQVYDNLMQYGSTGATTFVQAAAAVALRDGDAHVRQMVAQCGQAREIICSALEAVPGIRLVRPAGAFYLFFSVEGMTNSRAVAFDLLDKAGVALAPGSAFSSAGEGWLRLCFGVSPGTLREAASRLQTYFSDWRGQPA